MSTSIAICDKGVKGNNSISSFSLCDVGDRVIIRCDPGVVGCLAIHGSKTREANINLNDPMGAAFGNEE